MTVDRVEKKNAFTPKITNELSDALTRLDEDDDLFVGVLAFAGDHTTAGLEMPLFFSEEARRDAARRKAGADVGAGRSVRARPPAAQAASDRGAGHHVHDRDRDRARRRHRGGGVRHSVLPVGAQARSRSARWGDGALRAARRLGQRDVPPAASGRVRRRRGLPDRTRARGRRRPASRSSGPIALAREMLQCSPSALVHTIANARLALDRDEPAAIAAIPAMAATVQATEDFQEGIASFIERRPAQFTGR